MVDFSSRLVAAVVVATCVVAPASADSSHWKPGTRNVLRSSSACWVPIRPASVKPARKSRPTTRNRAGRSSSTRPAKTVDILDVRNPSAPTRIATHRRRGARHAEQRCRARRPRRGRDRSPGQNRSGRRRLLHRERRADRAGARRLAARHAHVHARWRNVLVANEGEPSGYGAGHGCRSRRDR